MCLLRVRFSSCLELGLVCVSICLLLRGNRIDKARAVSVTSVNGHVWQSIPIVSGRIVQTEWVGCCATNYWGRMWFGKPELHWKTNVVW